MLYVFNGPISSNAIGRNGLKTKARSYDIFCAFLFRFLCGPSLPTSPFISVFSSHQSCCQARVLALGLLEFSLDLVAR